MQIKNKVRNFKDTPYKLMFYCHYFEKFGWIGLTVGYM